MVIEGLVIICYYFYVEWLNLEISCVLDVDIVFVCVLGNENFVDINYCFEIVVDIYGGYKSKKVVGCIFNKVNVLLDEYGRFCVDIGVIDVFEYDEERCEVFCLLFIFFKGLVFLGSVDWNVDLVLFCVIDVVKYFDV